MPLAPAITATKSASHRSMLVDPNRRDGGASDAAAQRLLAARVAGGGCSRSEPVSGSISLVTGNFVRHRLLLRGF